MDIKRALSGKKSEEAVAKTQVEWLLHYGLHPSEVPSRLSDRLTAEDRIKLLGK